jgi:hypothetical protein
MSKKHKTKAETDDHHQLRATSSLIESERERERERERSLETHYCDALRNGPKFGIPTF